MNAKFNVGETIVRIPAAYLDQQTSTSSIFNDVPSDKVDISALIEANRTAGVAWYKTNGGETLHISVPTELIEWED